MHPEKMEEEGGEEGRNDSLKRKFSEIDDAPTPTISDSFREFAKKKNTIAFVETPIEKSEIIIKLIEATTMISSSDSDDDASPHRVIIFLAPTVNQVKQHCSEIKAHVMNLMVEDYFGAKGVDKWTSDRWLEEVTKQNVMVMTPQILLDALRSAFLKLEMICLLVIDECHRTTGHHPYAKLMKEFYNKSIDKPKIFGLTSPALIRKEKVSELESLMESQVFYPEEQKGTKKFATTIKEGPVFYDPPPLCSLELKEKLKTLHLKFDVSLLGLQEMDTCSSNNLQDKFETYQNRLSIDYGDILHCLDNLGLICGQLAAEISLEKISEMKEESETYKEYSMACKEFLENTLSTIGEYLHQDLQQNHLSNLGRVSPKLQELFHLLDSLRGEKQKPCLILVERIITAKVVERFVKKEASLSYLNVLCLTGKATPTHESAQETHTDDSYHVGKVNLLFVADLVQEEIQVPNCSCLICFDLPKTVCIYSLSKKHAKQSNSKSIMFLERGNQKQRDHLYDLMQREDPIRDPKTPNPKLCPPPVTNSPDVKENGATVIPNPSITVFKEAATTQNKKSSPVRNEQIPPTKLRKLDSLDNNLVNSSVKEKVASSKSKSSPSAAGSTKRKELHGTIHAKALLGNWGENLDGATFQAYKFDFCCNISEESYSSFFLLVESTLAEDVGNIEIDLYLVRKFLKASVSPCGQIRLSSEEMDKAKCFQQFFFNGMFGKLFVGSKSLGTKREFLLQTDTSSLWDPSFMFLLLPVETKDLVSSTTIDWSAINSCASIVDFLKKNSLLELSISDATHCNISSTLGVLLKVEEKETNLIHFANASSDKNSLEEIVVIAIHTGRIYSVVEAVKDSSAMSPFEDDEYSTFAEYFNKKYGIVLARPHQPLMKLKQSHHAHNLLVNFDEEVAVKTEPESGNVRKRKPNVHAYMPPELLVRIDVPRPVLKSIYVLPSAMHRLESLMLASQLREEIDCNIDNFSISSTSILEAITTLTCAESFSMERLELLGDSVLKYVVSCYLFLKYPDKDEGQLSRHRQSVISNSNLHRLATDRKLQGFIRNGAFEPRRWTAPGQLSLFPSPCKCGIDTREVPLDPKFFTENMTIKIGKSCDMGHRWIVSKSLSDCAEALIGAYYVSGGLTAALHMMKWLGLDVDFDPNLVTEAINRASLRCSIMKNDELAELESKIQHEFSSKILLKEAISHFSLREPYSYERLEFLGDSVLDFLITSHLFNAYTQTGPGEMTDLRSACVNNENFAQVAVKNNLHTHLQHQSTPLDTQINEYLKSFSKPDETSRPIPSIQGPKVLGDLVESIAGALLLDTRLDLDQVWRVFEPLLSPLVTPDKLQLPPYRELSELCDSLGYFFRVKCVNDGVKAKATIQLQLEDVLLTGDGLEQTNKLALGKAASNLLKQLEKRNISRKVLIEDKQSSMNVDLATDCTNSNRETPSLDSTGSIVIPGSTKRKELHGTIHAKALLGNWGENLDGAIFQAYKFDFRCNISEESYSSFFLLLESTLAEDVGNIEMDLYLVRKVLKASVSPCGQIRLSNEEMVKAKCFQQFFFNGMFGKLFVGSNSLGTKREFLLQTDTSSLWDPSFMFLLLPIETKDLVSSTTIDWSAINSCASIVDFLKKNSLLELSIGDGTHCNTPSSLGVLLEVEEKETNLIHFANTSSDKNNLEEIVVIAIHTGRIYSIVEAVKDSSAMSPFEDDEYSTFAEYFNKKYGILLARPHQPLMKLKQSHHAHNLLVNFDEEVAVKTEPESGNVRKRKPNVHVYMPPELLVRIDVPRPVLKSIYVLPSAMHRLESLMLASQLREEIDCSIDNFSISSTSILEAITTITCAESFSMERLEHLGDSVLKYVVSCYLFLKYPDKDEGKLSEHRKSVISNSNLHRLATDRKLQGFIRNGAFEPRRWTAPGQLSLFPSPCKCGIDTREVPLESKFFTENMTIKIGKSCDMGHRWIVSKSLSDCAEALIGAYYVSGGLTASLHMMKWLGLDVDFDPNLVTEAISRASLRCSIMKNDELAELESKIQHEFSSKILLKEAISHLSLREPYSYERLEFLGDSVLDFLITRHLFNAYTQTGPGEMTDLRSACVNNENFAQVAVKNNLHTHLQHQSTPLNTQINEYLKSFSKPDETSRPIPSIQGPTVLGDLVESIAGALLLDTRLDLDQVWRVFEPLLSPLVTPDKLQLPPYRELSELCDSLGYFFREKCVNDGVKAKATIQLQLEDVLLTGDGLEQKNKLALGKAASHLLKQLEKRNISRKVSIEDNQSSMDVDLPTDCTNSNRETPALDSTGSIVIPVIGPVNMKKGGPRGTLHEFCKKHLWPMPTYETSEEKSRTAFVFMDGDEKRESFSSFVSTITLRIPNLDVVMYEGEARPDKKSSFDSAVVQLLYELERRKILTIKK